MESLSNQQLLKRIASLVSENKVLKEKYRAAVETCNQISLDLDKYRGLADKIRDEHDEPGKFVYQKVRFETITIMFVEIWGLSDVTNDNAPGFIDKFDDYIFRFSDIAKKYKLLKLHSIGDNFVCAGGISEKNIINPFTVILAAFEMLNLVEEDMQNSEYPVVWSINIGIHTGAVTALVGGPGNVSYHELKGDAMNDASRIVSVGRKNTVTISGTTYELVKELFDCKYISALPVKYRNKLELFSVFGIKKELAVDAKRYFPNPEFRTKLMLVQFGDLQEYILDILEKELPEYLYYHNVKHTVDVVTQSELIGWAEGLNDHQLLLLKTAALFHDAGHTISYANHEERSVDIAQKILPNYNYVEEEIDEICRIIMATKLPPKPADLLESIICDSDLDYLGRTDFVPVSNTLYAELKVQNPLLTLNDWNKMQVKFIGSHQYFTKTGRKLRNVKKQEQIERIKQMVIEK